MCNPLIAAAAAAYVGGNMLKNSQQSDEVAGRQSAIDALAQQQQQQYDSAQQAQRQFQQQDSANNTQQQGFQQQKQQAFTDLQPTFDLNAQTAAQTAAANQRMAIYNANTAAPGAVVPTSADAPQVVNTEMARQTNDALQFGKQQAQALANMGAWGDTMFGNKVALNNTGQDINKLGSFAQGDNNLLNYQGNIANTAVNNANALIAELQRQAMNKASAPLTSGGFGSMLMAGGQALGTAGAMGAGPSWGDLFGGGGGYAGSGGGLTGANNSAGGPSTSTSVA